LVPRTFAELSVNEKPAHQYVDRDSVDSLVWVRVHRECDKTETYEVTIRLKEGSNKKDCKLFSHNVPVVVSTSGECTNVSMLGV